MRPANSWPRIEGGWISVVFSPRRMRKSVPHTVFAPTSTRTSPGPASGVSTSLTFISFGPLNTAAIMRLSLRCRNLIASSLSCHVPDRLVHQLAHPRVGFDVLVHVELVLLVGGGIRLDAALGVNHVLGGRLDVRVDPRPHRRQHRRAQD